MSNDNKPLCYNVHPRKKRAFLEKLKFYFYFFGIGRKSLSEESFDKVYVLKENTMITLSSLPEEKEIKIIFLTKDFQKNIVLTEEFLKQSKLPTEPLFKALRDIWKKQYNEDLTIE